MAATGNLGTVVLYNEEDFSTHGTAGTDVVLGVLSYGNCTSMENGQFACPIVRTDQSWINGITSAKV